MVLMIVQSFNHCDDNAGTNILIVVYRFNHCENNASENSRCTLETIAACIANRPMVADGDSVSVSPFVSCTACQATLPKEW